MDLDIVFWIPWRDNRPYGYYSYKCQSLIEILKYFGKARWLCVINLTVFYKVWFFVNDWFIIPLKSKYFLYTIESRDFFTEDAV